MCFQNAPKVYLTGKRAEHLMDFRSYPDEDVPVRAPIAPLLAQ
jgi:hypothetical protein